MLEPRPRPTIALEPTFLPTITSTALASLFGSLCNMHSLAVTRHLDRRNQSLTSFAAYIHMALSRRSRMYVIMDLSSRENRGSCSALGFPHDERARFILSHGTDIELKPVHSGDWSRICTFTAIGNEDGAHEMKTSSGGLAGRGMNVWTVWEAIL